MELNLTSIKRENKNNLDLNFSLNLDNIDYHGEKIKLISPIVSRGKLYTVDEKLYLTLSIDADTQISCSRCLKPITYHFQSSINAELIQEHLLSETDNQDEDIIEYKGDTLYLDELVKENMVMNFPMKIVCASSCKGLCPKCGINLNDHTCDCSETEKSEEDDVDPRLAKLKEFLQQD